MHQSQLSLHLLLIYLMVHLKLTWQSQDLVWHLFKHLIDVWYSLVQLQQEEGRKEMFYLTTHFIYGYMASDIWLRTILILREETCCRHIGYSFRLAARVLLYAPSHRQDSTYHSLCYTSRGALAGTRNTIGRKAQNTFNNTTAHY